MVAAALSGCTRSGGVAPSGESACYTKTLDSLMEQCEDFERVKLVRLSELRHRRDQAKSAADRYLYNSLLFEEFITYNADSAAKYADLNLELARREGNRDWENRSKMSKGVLLTATGLLADAGAIMHSIDRSSLPPEQLIDYYGNMIFLYSNLGNYAGGDQNAYYARERLYKDSIMQVITPDHPEYYWFRGWDIIGTDKEDDEVVAGLERKLAANKNNTHQDAKDAYILAKLYSNRGDSEMARKYMTLSAIIDVRIANAEIASLEELAKMVFRQGEGDIDRAYSYINYSLNKAISFPSRVRAIGISKSLDEINAAYQERNRREQQRTRLYLVLACILAAILAAAIVVNIIQKRRLRRQGTHLDMANKSLNASVTQLSEAREQLADVNARLRELNADLKAKNEELNEANYVKEEYIGYIFTICSNYIRKLDDFRKNIHVKAVTKKYKEILADTEDGETMKDELKEFYRSFDSVFLHIYPDFVNDFNALLQDDKRIIPKEGELLNTELRIYALVRLGITDSIKIAEFLHCSPQTVYNNRFRVRNKALVPKKDFAEVVRRLGKFMDRPS